MNQFSAVEYLTPTDYQYAADGMSLPTAWNFNPDPSLSWGFGTGRATPDVSTDADPFTGYEVYDSQYSPNPLEAGWGGTSFVAPQLNGSTALIDCFDSATTGAVFFDVFFGSTAATFEISRWGEVGASTPASADNESCLTSDSPATATGG